MDVLAAQRERERERERDQRKAAGDNHGDDERLKVAMFDERVGATSQRPEATTKGAL